MAESSERAQSVARGRRGLDQRWAWWDEVNPEDSEVAAQPWSNLGLLDGDVEGRRRFTRTARGRKCSACMVAWADLPDGTKIDHCWACGRIADDTLPYRGSGDPGPDGGRRFIAGGTP